MFDAVQRWESYTARDHLTWQTLYRRMLPVWESHANSHFLHGIQALGLDPNHIPRLTEINRRLRPLTGFQARAVTGYLAPSDFFNCLRVREFPTTITIRDAATLDYLPEPDIFHDVAGHVPMHTEPAFANALARFGACGCAANTPDALQALARFFWFTIEFGLMESREGLKAYGSGLLSSHGELEHALDSPEVERRPFDLQQVIQQDFEIDHYQPLLFFVKDFDHLFSEIQSLERFLNLSPDWPIVTAA